MVKLKEMKEKEEKLVKELLTNPNFTYGLQIDPKEGIKHNNLKDFIKKESNK